MLSKQEIAGLRELHRLAHDSGDTRAKVDYMVAVDANLPALLDIAEAVANAPIGRVPKSKVGDLLLMSVSHDMGGKRVALVVLPLAGEVGK
jgi:hypothetical protein